MMERLTEFLKKENKYISDVTLCDYVDDNGFFPISEDGEDKVIKPIGYIDLANVLRQSIMDKVNN